MKIFKWCNIKNGLPPKDNHGFYKDRYSVPVIGYNEVNDQLYDLTIIYDFESKGWCFCGLPDGPDKEDYEIFISHFVCIRDNG